MEKYEILSKLVLNSRWFADGHRIDASSVRSNMTHKTYVRYSAAEVANILKKMCRAGLLVELEPGKYRNPTLGNPALRQSWRTVSNAELEIQEQNGIQGQLQECWR